ncbi:MAG: ATP-binding protein [Bacteroidales bacterium]|nr:ATP-binding protein [Bacteroidales bacterium]MCF8402632.1 ATP-binding protein [Bacteroidales bacterium]
MEKTINHEINKEWPVLLGNIFDETIGNALSLEVSHLIELKDSLFKQIKEYQNKTSGFIDRNNIQGLLFESFDASVKINNMLGEYIEQTNKLPINHAIQDFNLKTFTLLNIDLSEEAKANKPSFVAAQINNLFKLFGKSFKAGVQSNTNSLGCFIYFHIVYNVLKDHLEKLEDFEKRRMSLLLNMWEKSNVINYNTKTIDPGNDEILKDRENFQLSAEFEDSLKLIGEFQNESGSFIQLFKVSFVNAFEKFEENLQIHNKTIASNPKKYEESSVESTANKLEWDLSSLYNKWQNTAILLTDGWSLELEINSLKFHVLKGYYGFTGFIATKFESKFDDFINNLLNAAEELLDIFKSSEETTHEETIKKLETNKTNFRRKVLLRLFPAIKSLLLNSEIPKEIDAFEKDSVACFETLSKSRYIIKEPVYDHPVEKSEMNKISPFDLVSYDMQPQYMEVFPSLKNAYVRHLHQLHLKLEEIPEVVDFSIESAIGYFNGKNDMAEALKVGRDGIKRAINKINDLHTLRTEFNTKELNFLREKIRLLISETSAIKNNDNALQIKIRITKAKAIEQSKAIRDKLIRRIKNFLPTVLVKIRFFYQFLVDSSIRIRKQFEGETIKGFIATEVSDYLAETEEAINRLPFIYQQLFKLEPLKTFDLYIENIEAIDKLKNAYSRWKAGKYAPTVVVGEKGSGKSSFVNRFLATKNITEQIIYHDLAKQYLPPEVIFKNIFEEIKQESVADGEKEVVQTGKIIVIDGLEKLFDARINGFSYLLKAVQLMAKTNKSIFWLVTCHTYSYNFLEKSVNISDFFGYHIELTDLSVDELITIIEKRHNISGFRLSYLPEAQKKSVMSLIKQSDRTDQSVLKSIYFERLQKIVHGNITQAFLYWMRSAAEVTDDIIYINIPGDANLGFVRSISQVKLQILRNILIHNGVSVNKNAEIFRIPIEKSEIQLEQLYDDGIVVKKEEIYTINPMIYKQVVDHMYNLNLLH